MKIKLTNFVLNKILKRDDSLKRTDEGVRTIRYPRLRKFKKKGKTLAVASQLVAIWYVLIFIGAFLTTDTRAYFNNVKTIENSLGAAESFPQEVWDRSSLLFSGIGGFCTKEQLGLIFSEIVNGGDGKMAGPTKFYLYKVDLNEAGPNKNNYGELIYSGDVPVLPNKDSSNNKTALSYLPNLNELALGKYKFKADQRPNHGNPNNDPNKEKENEIWGPEILITDTEINKCKNSNGSESGSPPPPEDTTPPGEVTEYKINQQNKNKLKITWNNPNDSDFSHINIYRNGTLLIGKITSMEYEDKSINESTKYTYVIKTVDLFGNESEGINLEITTIN